MLIRLQKYLADRGVASRRKCEEYIREGFIKVNGKVVKEMGVKIDPDKDTITPHPSLAILQQNNVMYAFHKPIGYVCTVTGPEEPKIMELLRDIPERVFPVGRLDKLTSGLLLLTNDGQAAYEMTHPKFEKEKEYILKVRQKVTPGILEILRGSIMIHGRKTQSAHVVLQGPHLLRMTLKEGRNRQIRRLCERAGLTIEKLKRIRVGKLLLGNLDPGEYRQLSKSEISRLLTHY